MELLVLLLKYVLNAFYEKNFRISKIIFCLIFKLRVLNIIMSIKPQNINKIKLAYF